MPPRKTIVKKNSKTQRRFSQRRKTESEDEYSSQEENSKVQDSGDESPDENFIEDDEEEEKYQYTKFSEKRLKTEYMKQIFTQGSNEYRFFCKFCSSGGLANSLKRHLNSFIHIRNTPEKDQHLRIEALTKLTIKKSSKIIIQSPNKEKEDKITYLQFLSFLMAQRLSFSQIEQIGNYLRDLFTKGQFDFLDKYTFKQEKVSKIASECFKPVLLEDLHKDLANNKFSFSIDSVTIGKENISAIQVKYLKELFHQEDQIKKPVIINRLLGITTMKESSDAETYLKFVKDKLLTNSAIKENLIGVVHDGARVLSGSKNGLVALMKAEENMTLYDLKDPCHGLNLTIQNSLEELHDDINNFVIELHSHFASPQRRSALRRIQEENNVLRPLTLKTYVKTRWLSLGNSLERVIQLWKYLIIYMEENIAKENKKLNKNKQLGHLDFKKIYNLLTNEAFTKKIEFLHFIISKINKCNINLQNKTLPIHELKMWMITCYTQILALLIKPEKIGMNDLKIILQQNWNKPEVQKDWFMLPQDFTFNLATINGSILFGSLESWNEKAKEDFYITFQPFLATILNYLQMYLPITDPIIESLDFVRLIDSFDKISNKIHTINNMFKIAEPESLTEELIRLQSSDFSVFRALKLSTLDMWHFIENNGYTFLPKLAKMVHVMPTSSSDLEQSFSGAKLIKTLLRNRLNESSFEALLLVNEELRINKKLNISDNLITSFDELMERISLKRKASEDLSIEPQRSDRLAESQQEKIGLDLSVLSLPQEKPPEISALNEVLSVEMEIENILMKKDSSPDN